ncbi:MAG: AlpA family phage regulatory protein [Rhodospirillaceae bacterium]|nr:AlpA family phage regulatory protein [Rhodospirillaceae bacterium]
MTHKRAYNRRFQKNQRPKPPPPHPGKEWLSAADIIGLGIAPDRVWIFRHERSGDFPRGIYMGPRCKRWRRADIESFVQERQRLRMAWDQETNTARRSL